MGGACDQRDLWAGSDGTRAPSGFWPRPSPLPGPVASPPAATPGESPEGRRATGARRALALPNTGLAVPRKCREWERRRRFRISPPPSLLGGPGGGGVTGPPERSPRPRRAEGQFPPEQGRASVLAAGWETPRPEGVPLTAPRVLTSQHHPPLPAGVIPESQPSASPSFAWRRRRGPARSPCSPSLLSGPHFPCLCVGSIPETPFLLSGEASVIGGGVAGIGEGAGVE